MSPIVGLGTGPNSRGWSLWITSVVMVIVAGIFVCLRVAVRLRKGHLGADDYTIVLSLLSSVLLSITEIQAVKHGYGRRYNELSVDARTTALMWFFGAQIMYKIVPTLNKISMVFLFHKIFSLFSKSFKIFCYVIQVVLIVSGLAFTIATVFQCRPIAAFWNMDLRRESHAKCFQKEPWWMSFSILHIVLDVLILLMPVREIMRMRMSRVEKLGLVLVFATGFFVTFTSIFRATTLAASANSHDPTYGPIPATVWAVVESNSGIICACLPLLKQPFINLLRPLGFSSPNEPHDILPFSIFKRSHRPRANSLSYPLSDASLSKGKSTLQSTLASNEMSVTISGSRDSEDRTRKGSLDVLPPLPFGHGIYVTSDIEIASETVVPPDMVYDKRQIPRDWPPIGVDKRKYGITWESN